MKSAPKTWTPTKYPNLYRHESGVYYARMSLAGKKTWRSLKTAVLRIARTELEQLAEDEEKRREIAPETSLDERG